MNVDLGDRKNAYQGHIQHLWHNQLTVYNVNQHNDIRYKIFVHMSIYQYVYPSRFLLDYLVSHGQNSFYVDL
ncbi:unnamed protein product [Schistosoma curassoni]|uniref:Ovule protein n=1 Tax=Schistosoma curassoni TaxID=6186 RepID=A0A183JXX6_9TREM|nr:unnamed protein product [Schistosoma curassoni]